VAPVNLSQHAPRRRCGNARLTDAGLACVGVGASGVIEAAGPLLPFPGKVHGHHRQRVAIAVVPGRCPGRFHSLIL
jgi:hypothetical protein